MSTLVDLNYEAIRELRGIAEGLRDLASSFSHTGNESMADKLEYVAQRIDLCSEAAGDAFAGLLNEAIDGTRQATENMVTSAFAALRKGK